MQAHNMLIASGLCLCLAGGSSVYSPFLLLPALAQSNADRKIQAERLMQQAAEQGGSGQAEAALQSWLDAYDIYVEIGDRPGIIQASEKLCEATGKLGNDLLSANQIESAVFMFEWSFAFAQAAENRQYQMRTLTSLGLVYPSVGLYNEAFAALALAQSLAQELNDLVAEASVLLNLGLVYQFSGRPQDALAAEQEGLAVVRQTEDRTTEVSLLVNMGLSYYALGDGETAQQTWQEALSLVQETGDSETESQIREIVNMFQQGVKSF